MRYRPLVALIAGLGVLAVDGAAAAAVMAAVTTTVAAIAPDVSGDAVVHRDGCIAARGAHHADHCPHDNLLRCFIRSPTLAYTFCSWSVDIYPEPVTVYSTLTVPPVSTSTTVDMPFSSSVDTTWPSSLEPSTADNPVPPSISTALPSTIATTVTITEITTDTVTRDRTQTTTVTVSVDSGTTTYNNNTNSTRYHRPRTPPDLAVVPVPTPARNDDNHGAHDVRAPHAAHTTAAMSLVCLDDLQPTAGDVTSACRCFSSGQPHPTTTATITVVQGAPTCAAGQPTFPTCLSDFHPYNCGTDHMGQIACSCVLTAEGSAQCTLGDYERDNQCTTSDDCADGWYCSVIDCFGDDVPSVCTKACPVVFPPGYGGGGGGSGGSGGGDGGDTGGEGDGGGDGGNGGDAGDEGGYGDGSGGGNDTSDDATGTSTRTESYGDAAVLPLPDSFAQHHDLRIIVNNSTVVGNGLATKKPSRQLAKPTP
ncbi:hypothetical protein SPI_02413 [Niveomyces insectorum RCEF 264]|uniref:Uncharacterized protein n=1 Tax=Niveomyces insectorum RCEF 264 TaxID=1081102 RepID=A0A167XZI6_9HYPO|nr:hypothetical protein SPI_02413 [Niveomyces insectorum RCEF 264]